MNGTFNRPDINAVRAYWDTSPLLSHELDDVGSPRFFDALDQAKREDSERFCLDYWGFDGHAGKSVLDVGCGPGWLTVNYARGGALVAAIDLTPRAVELTNRHLSHGQVRAATQVADAEALPFADDSFDLVVASGVLHHTPDPLRAFREALRVTRPGGAGRITLYRKGVAHSRLVFPLTRLAMRLAGLRHPASDLARNADDVDDFIRRYDGDENPIGIGKPDRDWARDLEACGWRITGREVHYFPRRFLPFGGRIPRRLHRALDRLAGTMIYFKLVKPTPARH